MCIRDSLAQNVLYGTGKSAQLPDRESAGKTGTAEEFHDAWYCGYTPQVACAVWVGHPEAQIPMTNVHGISAVSYTHLDVYKRQIIKYECIHVK